MGTKHLRVYGMGNDYDILYTYDPPPTGDQLNGVTRSGAGYYPVLTVQFPAAKRAGYELDLATRGTIVVHGDDVINHRAVPPKVAAALRASWDTM